MVFIAYLDDTSNRIKVEIKLRVLRRVTLLPSIRDIECPHFCTLSQPRIKYHKTARSRSWGKK